MGLMELIVIARCAEAKGSANLLRSLAISAFRNNGKYILLLFILRKCKRIKSSRR
jgi:hypothetical protein